MGLKTIRAETNQLSSAMLDYAQELRVQVTGINVKEWRRLLETLEDEESAIKIQIPGLQGEHTILTKTMARERALSNLNESICYFNLSFVFRYTPSEVHPLIEEMQKANVITEGFNAALIHLVGDRLGDLVDEWIREDGWGAVLSSYDHDWREMDNDYIGLRVN